MHLELVVPGLFPDRESLPGALRSAALELLLARGRRRGGEAASLELWLCKAFDLEGPTLPAGALTALAGGQDPGAHFWLRADPVHLRADRDRLLLIPSRGFTLTAAEAEQLAAALNRHFASDLMLQILRPDVWYVQAGSKAEINSNPPIELAGKNVDPNLPEKHWHALLNEIQMALYGHAVNTEREQRGDPVVNSVWLWGAGRLPAKASGPWQSVSTDDCAVLGLARLAGMRYRASGPGAEEWLARAPEDGRHLVVLDALRGVRALGDLDTLEGRLRSLEESWFAPLLATLKAGRIGMVTLHVPDAGASFETVRGDLRRFWRRVRPLSSYAADAA